MKVRNNEYAQLRPSGRVDLMPHPLDNDEMSPGDGGGGRTAAAWIDHEVNVAVQDQGRRFDMPKLCAPIPGFVNGADLPGESTGVRAISIPLPGPQCIIGPRLLDSLAVRIADVAHH